MENQIQNVKQIAEVTGTSTVNEYLKLGWILLNTVSEKDGDSGWFKYVLGWTKDELVEKPKLY